MSEPVGVAAEKAWKWISHSGGVYSRLLVKKGGYTVLGLYCISGTRTHLGLCSTATMDGIGGGNLGPL